MKKWPMLLIYATEALIVLAAVYFEPTYCVRGKLWGEAFFEGRPTSYWRAELEHWEVKRILNPYWRGYKVCSFERRSTQFEEFRERWFPAKKERSVNKGLFWLLTQNNGPSILRELEAAAPVLREMLHDPSPKIRLFAQIGLGMNPQIPGDEE
jgi:hypothetical protein